MEHTELKMDISFFFRERTAGFNGIVQSISQDYIGICAILGMCIYHIVCISSMFAKPIYAAM